MWVLRVDSSKIAGKSTHFAHCTNRIFGRIFHFLCKRHCDLIIPSKNEIISSSRRMNSPLFFWKITISILSLITWFYGIFKIELRTFINFSLFTFCGEVINAEVSKVFQEIPTGDDVAFWQIYGIEALAP